MRPCTANCFLIVAYLMIGFCWLFVSAEDIWRWLGIIGGLAVVSAMAMLKRPTTGRSILSRNGLWLPFYIP